MNKLALFKLAIASAGYQNVLTTLQDAQLLYEVDEAAQKSGKFSIGAMVKDGSFDTVSDAAERSILLINKLKRDKTHGPDLIAFLETL